MNGKSKQYSHVQEWQKIGSGMLSGAGFYLSPCKDGGAQFFLGTHF